jgi:hypothetical protein
MNSSRDQQIETLQAALKAARENENRWMESSAEFSTDAERVEQWFSTARLRRLEVERLEALLAGAVETCSLAQSVGSETVEVKERMGETA